MRAAGGLLVAVLAGLAAACGASTTSKPLPPALPPPAPVTPTMAASGTDPGGDAGAPVTDIVSAQLEQRNGELVAHIVMAAPPKPATGQLEIGAYLLSSEDDDNPAALRVLIPSPGAAPEFTLGPYDQHGTPVKGSISGSTVEIQGGRLAQGTWRFVQFYAEGDAGDDTLPDASDQANDMIPIADPSKPPPTLSGGTTTG